MLPKASCSDCANVTKRFEQTCARQIFGPLRVRLGMPTRNKRERPEKLPVPIRDANGTWRRVMVNPQNYPGHFIGARLPPPGIFRGVEPSEVFEGSLVTLSWDREILRIANGAGTRVELQRLAFGAFCRLLTKIAHGFAISQIGVGSFTHFLPDLILGRSNYFPHVMGGDPVSSVRPPRNRHLELQLNKLENTNYLFVTIRLFCFLDTPQYAVVVGEDKRDPS